MPDKNIPIEKQRLRGRMRELALMNQGTDSSSLLSMLRSLPAWQEATSVLLYAPLPGEIDLMPILKMEPTGSTKKFFFPRIEAAHLSLYQWSDDSPWLNGPYNIKEPDSAHWKQSNPSVIDLALIPGLAFDHDGGRLGRGKGYYDKLLSGSEFRGIKIGVCHPWQLVESIPREPHDIAMDLVLSGEE